MNDIKGYLTGRYGSCSIVSGGRGGQEYLVPCPFCNAPKTKRKLSLNFTIGAYKCWVCSATGRLRDLLGDAVEGMSFKAVPYERKPLPLPHEVRPLGSALVPLNLLDPRHHAAVYLDSGRSRPFDRGMLTDHYNGVYVNSGEQFGDGENFWFDTTDTIAFPVYHGGKLIGWQARLLYDPKKLTPAELEARGIPINDDGDWVKPPKYFTSPHFPKGRVFYNWDRAITQPCIVVTEGVFDVFAVGDPGCAGLGKGLAGDQIDALKTCRKPVILLLDPDAEKDAIGYELALRPHVPVFRVLLPSQADPGDCTSEFIWHHINAAING